jgi:hypothetical protein
MYNGISWGTCDLCAVMKTSTGETGNVDKWVNQMLIEAEGSATYLQTSDGSLGGSCVTQVRTTKES